MRTDWKDRAVENMEGIFARHGIKLTLGGEPTYVPKDSSGAEWNYSAVGPTKLDYAWKVANTLLSKSLPGGVAFYCPGKLYPGETNPRWVLKLIANKDGTPIFSLPASGSPADEKKLLLFRDKLGGRMGIDDGWRPFRDPRNPAAIVWAVAIDHDKKWKSHAWPGKKLTLSEAEGPAGLRLPLQLLPKKVSKRALTLELHKSRLSLFIPPVLQKPFLELLSAIKESLAEAGINQIELQGYTPADEGQIWTQAGIAADPGVLEINLPACKGWKEYDYWIHQVSAAAGAAGLHPWKDTPGDFQAGTGGGNHLLWGGATIEENPFFSRPVWLSSIIRYWQRHPSLAYLFTGCYVGPSSQAPRPDESARDLYDLEMAYAFLESLPEGDHRSIINETLRHLQTDVTGNSHRSEISFDKFWNGGTPAGALGLIEFRAIESLPRPEWMSAVALLWTAAAALLTRSMRLGKLKNFGSSLHDRYFLPTILWLDLEEILGDLRSAQLSLDSRIYRDIWEWKFPVLLDCRLGEQTLTIRKAHEGWPLLCETPVEGGSTSRFVDTSMQRLEFCANKTFGERYRILLGDRPMPLDLHPDGFLISGLRYRRTNLYPSLHPGILPQIPLRISIVDAEKGIPQAEFEMGPGDLVFRKIRKRGAAITPGRPCKAGRLGDLTYDLRIP